MTKPLCIYHDNCIDGFTAAWHVYLFFGDQVEFHQGRYGDASPDVAGRDVIIVDFSYKRPVLLQMAATARSIVILDHHKTAAEDLTGLDPPSTDAYMLPHLGSPPRPGLYAIFDMNRSGAGMAADFFFPNMPRLKVVDHVEDRDLWRFALPGTREVHAALSSHPFDFAVWDALMRECPTKLIAEGAAILRKHDRDVAVLVDLTRRRMVIGGHDVPVGNVAPQWVSDACHLMAQGEPFAAAYYDAPGGRMFSLRSTDAGLDVSSIAKDYGGGGHRNAAGFKMPRGWEGDTTGSGHG